MLPAATLLCRGYPRRFLLLGLASSLRPLAPGPWASHPAAELVARVLGACGLQRSLAPDDGGHFAIGLSGVCFRTGTLTLTLTLTLSLTLTLTLTLTPFLFLTLALALALTLTRSSSAREP